MQTLDCESAMTDCALLLPSNLIGAGTGKPGIDVLAGNGIFDTGNTFYVVNLGKSVQFAAGVNGSPVRPVITSAVDDGQGSFRVKGRVRGNPPGKTVYVEIDGVYSVKGEGGVEGKWVTQLNLVWGEADAVGNFDFTLLFWRMFTWVLLQEWWRK